MGQHFTLSAGPAQIMGQHVLPRLYGCRRLCTLGPNLWVFPLEQTGHVGVAKSEHPRLTNGEIILEEFQPM